ncbi:putative peptidyl-tRNA hydrolase PTRHD1 [Patiria miniata]|uniref:peptidyl-tRNA hydrolase n=1 Tax=Patiria miniata TaxID=46514 RepID=A0A913ZJD0_PATMI|nr:putative peptidyl-tRNA hydrolase PTRHD1 [Patiria miniata]
MTGFVQYVVVRGDLLHILKWPTGAVIAQACHACTAVLHRFREDENVHLYTSNLDNMHKVVLEAQNEDNLRTLSAELTSARIDHTLWIEQPENCATCIAVKPYPKEHIQKHFKKFKLFK